MKLDRKLLQTPSNKTFFASRRMVPRLVMPGRGIWTSHYFSKHLEEYDYLLFEKDFIKSNKTIKNNYEKLLQRCKKTKIVEDNSFYLLLEGNVDDQCYAHLKESPQSFSY